MRFKDSENFPQLRLTEPFIPAQLNRSQPKLSLVAGFMNMHVDRLVRFGAIKADPVPSQPAISSAQSKLTMIRRKNKTL